MNTTTENRRGLLRTIAAGLVGAGLLAKTQTPADAATGDPLVLGQDNTGDPTNLYGDFTVRGDGVFSRDHATGQEAVLYAYNGDSGGILVQSDNLYGIRARGYPAIQVEGQLAGQFAGTVTVPAGASSVKHAMPYVSNTNQFGTSLVVASLQQHRAGVHVEAVTPAGGGGSFTIYLNKAVTQPTRVGWIIVN